VSHYGTNSTILKPTVNQTALPVSGFFDVSQAQDHNKECNNCHKNYPFNLTYGNATQKEGGHTSTGTCDQCHLNGQNSITVSNGTQVLITSTINDISGGGYYASRVGGAEYYIDSDPGVGKGIALYAGMAYTMQWMEHGRT